MTYVYHFKHQSSFYDSLEDKLFEEAQSEYGDDFSPDLYREWLRDTIQGVIDADITMGFTRSAFSAESLTFESEEYMIAFLLTCT